jgi:competence protein ComEA
MTHRRVVAAVLAFALAALVAPGFVSAETKPQPAAKINLNTATVAQLEALPGVGAQLAARIVEHRQKAGSFRSTQELMNVKGIGEKNFAKLEAYLTVGEAPKPAAR